MWMKGTRISKQLYYIEIIDFLSSVWSSEIILITRA